MIEGLSMELVSGVASASAGWMMKMRANSQAFEQKRWEWALKSAGAADASADKAVKRIGLDVGRWTRRFIVVVIMFSLIAPFFLAWFDKPVVVEVPREAKELFWGLFKWGGNPEFVEIKGFLMIPEVRVIASVITGFYFGQGAAKK